LKGADRGLLQWGSNTERKSVQWAGAKESSTGQRLARKKTSRPEKKRKRGLIPPEETWQGGLREKRKMRDGSWEQEEIPRGKRTITEKPGSEKGRKVDKAKYWEKYGQKRKERAPHST